MKTFYDSKNNQLNLIEERDIESSDNYIKFPDGTLICYGGYGIENNYEVTLTFPFKFINSKYSIVIIQRWYDIAYTYVVNNKTNSSCDFIFFNKDLSTSKGSHQGDYVAIGKWK